MTRPPYPPNPPYPPYPPHTSPAPYPPYPPYPPSAMGGGASVGAASAPVAGPPSERGQASTTQQAGPTTDPGGSTRFPGDDRTNPLSIYFNYGRYDIVDATNEGLGQGQLAKLTKFVADASSSRAREVVVDGFASPEDNLPGSQLPLNRANAVKNRLDQLFATASVKPTISSRTTNVLSGDPSVWPSLRRADIYITARSA